jgi:hypothetical protein
MDNEHIARELLRGHGHGSRVDLRLATRESHSTASAPRLTTPESRSAISVQGSPAANHILPPISPKVRHQRITLRHLSPQDALRSSEGGVTRAPPRAAQRDARIRRHSFHEQLLGLERVHRAAGSMSTSNRMSDESEHGLPSV